MKGVVLGDFRGLNSDDVYDILSSQMEVNFPVIYTPNIGHVKNKITLPVGAKVTLDTRTKSLVIKSRTQPLSVYELSEFNVRTMENNNSHLLNRLGAGGAG